MLKLRKSKPDSKSGSLTPEGPVKVYRGRFAPSPTGPLHLGSLLTAVASYLDAKAHGGEWLVRIEDLDPPREEAGAQKSIVESLYSHGLISDGPIMRQSERSEAYDNTLKQLAKLGVLYTCSCSRKYLSEYQAHHPQCGYWADGKPEGPSALRLRLPQQRLEYFDCVDRLPHQSAWSAKGLSDCVLYRKEGLYAYALAVVVDDREQGITSVIRGRDLLESTLEQHYLFQVLGHTPPIYGHIPLLTDSSGIKLSKQNHAPPLDNAMALQNLNTVLRMLAIPQTDALIRAQDPGELLNVATGLWCTERLAKIAQLTEPASNDHSEEN